MQQTPDNVYYVCGSFHENIPHHEYNNIQKVIDNIPDYSRALIILYDNFLGIPELMMRHRQTNITINGQNQFGIGFGGDMVVKVGERQTLKFRDITYIRGGEIALADVGANCGIYNTQSAMCYFNLTRQENNNIYIHNTKFYAADGHPAIDINNPDTNIEIFNSYVKGSHRRPAIMFNVESDRKLKIKGSTILHGSGIDHQPIQVDGDFLVSGYIYNCGGVEKLVTNSIDNLIVNNNNNIADENIDF